MVSPDHGDNLPNRDSPEGTHDHADSLGALALGGNQTRISELMGRLSPEQLAYTEAVIKSMVESLSLDLKDIHLIPVEQEGSTSILAMDASPNGQFIGLYRDIVAKRKADLEWYTIVANGERIDPLEGCTRRSYEAMIIDARARGETYLPDSLALNQHNGHVWTATMMTGEPLASEGRIWIGSSSSYDKVNFVDNPIDRGGKSFRVRPAVEIARLEE